MARAIELASNGLYTTDPNPRVGCVIVKDGVVRSEGWHERAGGPHAEVAALQHAGADAEGSTVYVTLEPCCHFGRTPPCADALIGARVAKVVVAGLDPNPLVSGKGLEKLREAGIAVECNVLTAEAEALNPGFIKRMRRQLPYVRCKVAMSLDGRTAMASGESQWITGEAARKDGQLYRARSSAIVTGIGTVLADDPSLNVRLSGEHNPAMAKFTDADQPLRVVLDSRLQMPAHARMLTLPGRVLVYTRSQDQQRKEKLRQAGADVAVIENESQHLDLVSVLQDLARRQVNEVLVEAGARLNGAFLTRRLIDELVFYIAPSLMGDQGKGAFHLPELTRMSQKVALNVVETRQIGVDWRIIARLKDTE
ncbi:MAG: bifunctional diaminohydroxyphosphoribosylaminopyrimidine deaminase/5-amino-6-(5-phosphoribosylamino)uracil reductase RibD [Gammaproteobacteria bacterium]|nr:bifunctional diaminohydroxyphosphoribosylaminopyrimidine deaminase/5-amino-6-(5-phosphoribosylamino)uracil reductase RibD [Gammaproteobacteria bacterium]